MAHQGHKDELPALTKRRIQAEVIGPIHAEMAAAGAPRCTFRDTRKRGSE